MIRFIKDQNGNLFYIIANICVTKSNKSKYVSETPCDPIMLSWYGEVAEIMERSTSLVRTMRATSEGNISLHNRSRAHDWISAVMNLYITSSARDELHRSAAAFNELQTKEEFFTSRFYQSPLLAGGIKPHWNSSIISHGEELPRILKWYCIK